ncbi:hypothetical protein [Fontibacillus sp. BL9]|uniref:hypothetical protein n=1 Tax=Fontibacillus sp. BL9 TaxID=3389971 RepID=UPI00397B525C
MKIIKEAVIIAVVIVAFNLILKLIFDQKFIVDIFKDGFLPGVGVFVFLLIFAFIMILIILSIVRIISSLKKIR